ncbi:dipeptidase 1 [Procambarus clarkii]|uniref:dipeptidase 1 n=1 Tax=Procambarus clarkii TaxID=6728 RepID=UPI003743D39D
MSVEERLSTALGHPLAPPHKHTNNTHANTHANTNANTQANTHTTPQAYSRAKTQAHVHTASQTHKHNHNTTTNTAGDDGSSAHAHAHAHGQGLGASRGSRLSRSVESLPRDIKEHILKCQCSCDHLGYGNFSVRGGVEVPAHVWGGVCLVLVLAGVAGVGVSVPLALKADPNAGHHKRLDQATTLLRETPLVDGHNDLPWNIRKFMHNKLHSFNFTAELKKLRPWSRSSWSHTDLPRLKEGRVGAQFWVSYVPCESQRLNAVQLTIEQIDLIKRLIDQYPDDLRLATSADEVEAAFKEGRIASLIGVEGGHAIQNSLGVLRALRDLGVRYLTLTHTCSTPWAECARAKETDLEDPDSPRGLTHFGKTVVREMNRLGLLVDLSHVSQATMKEALEVSRAPVIFSHSSVYAICKNPRNVPDDILRKVAVNGGVVMVSFYNHFLTCSEQASVKDVVAHINHVRKIAGVQHVGIGADFDGVNKLPEGLEDVSRYPHLFAELLADSSWTLDDLRLLAGYNLLRVMRDVEKVRVAMRQQKVAPYEEEVPPAQLEGYNSCSYKFTKDPDDS